MPNLSKKGSKGFTLIELLVVITIIGILITLSLAAIQGVRRAGRDGKRQSDLRSIQSALEQYFADQFYYPASLSFGSALSAGSKTYMNSVPTDPLSSPQYSYIPSPASCGTNCTSYCLYAKLENTSPGLGSCSASGTHNFAVTPP